MGAEVHYECEGGFRHVGPASIAVCTAGAFWSHPSLQCEGIQYKTTVPTAFNEEVTLSSSLCQCWCCGVRYLKWCDNITK